MADRASPTIAAVLAELGTDGAGLTGDEAMRRRERFGRNRMPEPRRPGASVIIAGEFRNPIFAVLAGAAVAAIAVRERVDGGFILVTLVLTGGFGAAMAIRAERAVRGLRTMLASLARVVRDGRVTEIPAEELVPGDRLALERGMRVPADARMLAAHALEADESVLTGESLPVRKNVGGEEDYLFQGTTIVEGSGAAVVVATGVRTRFAGIAASLAEPREETPLQQQLRRFSGQMALVVVGLSAAVVLIGLARGEPFGPMLATAVAVAVAAIPEGLAVAVTAVLAVGAVALARRRCLVRRLVAAETLGSVSVILTDKTGTITEGRMRAEAIRLPDRTVAFAAAGALSDDVRAALEAAVLGTDVAIANHAAPAAAWRFHGSGTEAAIVASAGETGIDVAALRESVRRIDRVPFSAEKKYSATLVERSRATPSYSPSTVEGEKQTRTLILLGAPERIVHAHAMPRGVMEEIERLASEGFRLIGVSQHLVRSGAERIADIRDVVDGATLLGIFLLRDPLRTDAAPALAMARAAGVQTVMVTGDHPATAARIARDVGLADAPRVCTGTALAQFDDATLRDRIASFDVFARVAPEDKRRLVAAWRDRGAVVAVTGDGVNDAPALVAADVGVAMGSGTDVAREAADLVLLDDRYATVVAGVAGGRVIWDNLRKVAAYLLASSFSEVILIAGALILGLPIPILPAQILWVNLVEDTLPAAALAFDPPEHGVMREPPRPRGEPLLSRQLRMLTFGVGITSDIVLLAVTALILRATGDLALTRTIVFGGLGIDALVYVFGIRSLRQPLWRSRPFANPWLLGAVAASFLLLIAGLTAPALQPLLRTVPIPAWGWWVIAGIGLTKLIAMEGVKAAFRRSRMVAPLSS